MTLNPAPRFDKVYQQGKENMDKEETSPFKPVSQPETKPDNRQELLKDVLKWIDTLPFYSDQRYSIKESFIKKFNIKP